MIRLLATLWRKFRAWRNRPRFPVYRRAGGYQAWKDKTPVRQASWAGVFVILALVMLACVVPFCGLGFYSQQRIAQRVERIAPPEFTPEVTAEITAESTVEITPEITQDVTDEATAEITMDVRIIGNATPTLTPFPLRTSVRTVVKDVTSFPTLPPAAPPTTAVPVMPVQTRIPVTAWYNPQQPQQPAPQFPAQPPVYTAPPLATLPPPPPTDTPTMTATNTVTATATPTDTATDTPTATDTETSTPTATQTYVLPMALFEVLADDLTVYFIDRSLWATEWNWDFESDGIIDSIEQNPIFVYLSPGVYTATLYAASPAGVSIWMIEILLGATPTPTPTDTAESTQEITSEPSP